MKAEQIKKILIDNSYVKEEDIKKAEAYAKSHNTDFLEYLFNEGILSKEILGQALAENFGVSYAQLNNQKIEAEIFKIIPEVMSEKKGLVAFKMDGITMLKQMRNTDWGKEIPVIMLTNLSEDDKVDESLKNGAFEYLVKSDWKLEDVVKKIRTRLLI